MLQFVEDGLYRFLIMREGITNAWRQPRILDQVAEAVTCQVQVSGTGVVARFSLFLFPDPGPSWQPVEHPLQYAH